MTRDTSMPEETTSNNMQVVMETEYQQIKQQLLVSSTSDGVLANRMGQREKMHNPGQLMELAKHIESAQSHVKAVAGGKLELISEQIKALQAQAREVTQAITTSTMESLIVDRCWSQLKLILNFHEQNATLNEFLEEYIISMKKLIEVEIWSHFFQCFPLKNGVENLHTHILGPFDLSTICPGLLLKTSQLVTQNGCLTLFCWA
eukprot:m.21086 g.21086  ORF g.21086 m.21086 type:complete len:204 (-) comp7027_c0_seq1:412-1023(-)